MKHLPDITTSANEILLELIPQEEINRVLSSDASCDISPDFLCFADTYYYLSKIIPKDWAVIDFGCAYNAQSYFFKEHKKFIAVEPMRDMDGFHFEHFCAPNCEYYEMTTGQFFQSIDYPTEKVFAICNNVPSWYNENSCELVRTHFTNTFTFYIE